MKKDLRAATGCVTGIGVGLCFWLLLFLAIWLTRGWWGG